ncbi:hypothetical protein CRYPD_1347 [uncultured Candidatus Thioglobus sp.]|nr:hypothetical protein CRYPD_1347 [uncultured Candidatus Thioglobus sp.]
MIIHIYAKVSDKRNSRLGKCLGFKTPYQVFLERMGVDIRQLGVVHL